MSLVIKNLQKGFYQGEDKVTVLKSVNVDIKNGDFAHSEKVESSQWKVEANADVPLTTFHAMEATVDGVGRF